MMRPQRLLDHLRQAGANHAKRAGQIDIDDVQPGLLIVATNEFMRSDSGGIHQDIGMAIGPRQSVHEGIDAVDIGDVEASGKTIDLLPSSSSSMASSGQASRTYRYGRTPLGQRQCNRLADPGKSTGDDRNPTFEVGIHPVLPGASSRHGHPGLGRFQ